MAVETDADRRLFVEEDDFAVPVLWDRGGIASSFPAIFDSEYSLLSSPLFDGGVEGNMPQIQCCSSDLPAGAAHEDRVTVGGKVFAAVEFKPDGTGMTVVRLREA